MLGQPLCQWRNALGFVDGGVVQNHRQRLIHLLLEPAEKAHKHTGRRVFPILGAEHLAVGEQCGKHVQALAPLGVYQMAFAALGPGAAVRVHSRETSFVQISQLNVSASCLVAERLHLYGCLEEGVFVAAFLKNGAYASTPTPRL